MTKRLKNILYATTAVLGAAVLSGCQSMDVRSIRGAGVSFIDDEGGAIERDLNTVMPRTYKGSLDALADNAKRIPTDLIYIVSRVPALVGVDPLYGRYFGQQRHGGFFELKDADSWRYHPHIMHDGKTAPFGAALFNIPDTVFNTVGGFGDLLGHTVKGPIAQPVNMLGVLPLTANTSKRQAIYNEGDFLDYDPSNDLLKFRVDGATDLIKVPVKIVPYVATSGKLTPDTLAYLWNSWREDLGFQARARLEPLELKFFNPDTLSRRDRLRMVVNTLPYAGNLIDNLGWRYTHRMENGKEMKVVSSIDGSIPIRIADDKDAWYNRLRSVGMETSAPGIIVNPNDPRLKPAEARTLSFLKAVFGVGVTIINYSSGSSGGTTSPGSSGGDWGGGSPGSSGTGW